MNCHACGAQLAGTARFCHKCGAQVGGALPQAAGWRGGLPWGVAGIAVGALLTVLVDRKSTRLNSSHLVISYAVFCLKKKKNNDAAPTQANDTPPRNRDSRHGDGLDLTARL